MSILIVKLGATGDVVRTSTLLHRLTGPVTWITEAKNKILLQDLRQNLRPLTWEEREAARNESYDLVINLEDTVEVGQFLTTVQSRRTYGAILDGDGSLRYTPDSSRWFDLSLISVHGRQKADQLKLQNRRTYQDLIFEGLGFEFSGEKYVLPPPIDAGLKGDVAISPAGGPVWPMKNWAYYDELKKELESRGLTVNVLPVRKSLLEHLGDVQNHRCLVSGDSLPMHLALGTDTPCVSLFTCTSPWEIFDYGLQKKIISPLLAEFFYQRGFDRRATTAISLEEVLNAVSSQLQVNA